MSLFVDIDSLPEEKQKGIKKAIMYCYQYNKHDMLLKKPQMYLVWGIFVPNFMGRGDFVQSVFVRGPMS